MTSGSGRVGAIAPEAARSNVNISSRQPTSVRDPPADQGYDVTRMREDEFERLAVYIVPDVACERGVPNRADQTLPRSLTLKPSLVLSTPDATVGINCDCTMRKGFNLQIFHPQTEGVWSTGVIPRGTRFGPFEGIPTPNFPSDKRSWKYFWRVSKHIFFNLLNPFFGTQNLRIPRFVNIISF